MRRDESRLYRDKVGSTKAEQHGDAAAQGRFSLFLDEKVNGLTEILQKSVSRITFF